MKIKGRFLDNFKWLISPVILVTLTMAFLSGIAVEAVNGEKITSMPWLKENLATAILDYVGKVHPPNPRAHQRISLDDGFDGRLIEGD